MAMESQLSALIRRQEVAQLGIGEIKTMEFSKIGPQDQGPDVHLGDETFQFVLTMVIMILRYPNPR